MSSSQDIGVKQSVNKALIGLVPSALHPKLHFYRPQSLRKGNIFTGVCHSVHRGVVCIPSCTPPDYVPPDYIPPRTMYPPDYVPPQNSTPHTTYHTPRLHTPPDYVPPGLCTPRTMYPPRIVPPHTTYPPDYVPP